MMNLIALITGMAMLMMAPANMTTVTEVSSNMMPVNTKRVYIDDEYMGELEFNSQTNDWTWGETDN